MTTGTSRLSDVARHVIQPSGICGTGWPAVRDTCARLGWGFDPWQDGAGRLILAKRKDGLYAADQILVSIPRQVGKTYLFAAIVFALCLLHPGLTVMWTAHRAKTAKETFTSMAGMAAQARVAAHVQAVVRGRGDEAITFKNGSRILFGAREHGFGRGFTNVGVLVFDEAQILDESALEDMIAAQNVAANPLTVLTGTPPRPRDNGEVFTMFRQEALDGENDGTLYIELSADRHGDSMDREQWRKANPSFPSRTPERAMLRMRKNLSEDSFRREALGIWDEVSRHVAVVSAKRWNELRDLMGPDDGVPPDSLAVDMSHGMDISIAGCWIVGELRHIEQVWAGSDVAAALTWITDRAQAFIPVLMDGISPAGALAVELKARRVKARITNSSDMAKACLLFEQSAVAGTISHGDQDSVTEALMGARKRPIRDAGGWGWDRRDPTCQIYPIVAATLALYGATEKKRTSSKGRVVVMR